MFWSIYEIDVLLVLVQPVSVPLEPYVLSTLSIVKKLDFLHHSLVDELSLSTYKTLYFTKLLAKVYTQSLMVFRFFHPDFF